MEKKEKGKRREGEGEGEGFAGPMSNWLLRAWLMGRSLDNADG